MRYLTILLIAAIVIIALVEYSGDDGILPPYTGPNISGVWTGWIGPRGFPELQHTMSLSITQTGGTFTGTYQHDLDGALDTGTVSGTINNANQVDGTLITDDTARCSWRMTATIGNGEWNGSMRQIYCMLGRWTEYFQITHK